ncbi:MAG TPA: hypothetical protein VGD78_22520 [Chthoniobacterales bacterium]
MTTRTQLFGHRERGSSLVMVMVGSLACMTIAVSLVTARNQAMKLGVREQLAHLAQLDLEIQTSNLNHQVTSLLTAYGGTINTSNLSTLVNNVTGVGSRVTNPNENNVNFYQVGAGATPATLTAALTPYTPQMKLVNGSVLASATPDPADLTDPLRGDPTNPSQGVLQNAVGTFAAQLNAAPSSGTTVFYPGKTSSLRYKVRAMPITIYSVYALGDTTLPASSFPGDAGRVYAGKGLTVSGLLSATRPLTAQQTIAFDAADPTSKVMVGTESQSATAGVSDQAQMVSGNQILQAGTQSKDVQTQTLPASSPGASPALPVPGSLFVYQCSYTAGLPNASGVVTGSALVTNSPGVPAGMIAPSQMIPAVQAALQLGITTDSNLLNGSWDVPSLNLPLPFGYMAAVSSAGTRLMNTAGTAPMQFIVLDYSHIAPLAATLPIPPGAQTFYLGGNPAQQAVLLRGFVDSTQTGTVIGGLSINSNLDIYISQGVAPAPSPSPVTTAISLMTSGRFHVTN